MCMCVKSFVLLLKLCSVMHYAHDCSCINIPFMVCGIVVCVWRLMVVPCMESTSSRDDLLPLRHIMAECRREKLRWHLNQCMVLL